MSASQIQNLDSTASCFLDCQLEKPAFEQTSEQNDSPMGIIYLQNDWYFEIAFLQEF